MNDEQLPYVWDYDVDRQQFKEILTGQQTLGRLDQDWAAVRLLEYASYKEIVAMLGFPLLMEHWHRWRDHIRSDSRRRGFDFLVEWLPEHHPELLDDR